MASFFVSRVDTEVDARLDKIGTAEAAELRGRAAIANARLAYQHYEQVFSSPRWQALPTRGPGRSGRCGPRRRSRTPPTPTPATSPTWSRPAWSTPCPRPRCALVADQGEVPADSVHGHYEESQQVLDGLRAVGIDYDDVVQKLEDDGVAKFDAPGSSSPSSWPPRCGPAQPGKGTDDDSGTTRVIVGASLAGAKAAETLRAEGFDGPVVLIGRESERPYERPPLSKGYLMGKAGRDKIYVHPPSGTPSTTWTCGSASRSPASNRRRTR